MCFLLFLYPISYHVTHKIPSLIVLLQTMLTRSHFAVNKKLDTRMSVLRPSVLLVLLPLDSEMG